MTVPERRRRLDQGGQGYFLRLSDDISITVPETSMTTTPYHDEDTNARENLTMYAMYDDRNVMNFFVGVKLSSARPV